MRHHAILTENGLEFRNGSNWHIQPFKIEDHQTLDDLLKDLDFPDRAIWMKTENLSRNLVSLFKQKSSLFDVEIGNPSSTSRGLPSQIRFNRKGESKSNTLILMFHYLEEWALSKFDPSTIERAITSFQDRFELSISTLPASTGIQMIDLQKRRLGKADLLIHPSKTLKPFAEREHSKTINWIRPLTGDEKKKSHLHAFDKNSMFMSACDVHLGIGDYERVKVSNDDFDKNLPALWKAKVKGKADDLLPNPVSEDQKWFYTPSIQLLKSLSYETTIVEAYIFPNHQKLLSTWHQKFTDLIEELKSNSDDVSQAVRKMAKVCANKAIGLLKHGKSKEDLEKWSYRPDWRGMIIAEASSRMYFNILKAKNFGFVPVASWVDCLFYVSDDPAPSSLPFVTDDRLSKMFHHNGVYDISSNEAKSLFDGSIGDFIKNIKKYGVTNNGEEIEF